MAVKIEKFLKDKENYTICRNFSEIPEYIKQMIYEDDISIGYSRDLITPLSDDFGLEKLFRYIKEYQPRTYEVLKDAKNLMYGVYDKDYLKDETETEIYDAFLAFELNGKALILDRELYGGNPDQQYFEERMNGRRISLPKEIVYSYYYEFIGLGIPILGYNVGFRNLPMSIYNWYNLDGHLEQMGVNKKRRIEVIKSYTKYFSKILNTNANAEYLYLFMDTEVYGFKEKKDYYRFFVFEDIEYGDIYVIKNKDYEKPKRLINPAEAIDKYISNVLSGEYFFNFDPYLEEIELDIEEINEYELVECRTTGVIKDKKKAVKEIMFLISELEISNDVCYKTSSGEYEHISRFKFDGEEIEIVGFILDDEENYDLKIYYSYKDGKHLLTYSKLYETELEKIRIKRCLEELSNNGNIKEEIVKRDENKFYLDLLDVTYTGYVIGNNYRKFRNPIMKAKFLENMVFEIKTGYLYKLKDIEGDVVSTHILSKNEIKKNPEFKKLNPEEQKSIIDLKINIMNLGAHEKLFKINNNFIGRPKNEKSKNSKGIIGFFKRLFNINNKDKEIISDEVCEEKLINKKAKEILSLFQKELKKQFDKMIDEANNIQK
ncbi:hypothetical protein [Streptobacillus moniliformis]|uniref:hypothetical protein n=1 Tax=Streptobacillus moniliformis TaxID=34105 RepID=UPI0007EEE242|nr:hypothetical protein [Streptobacillus moniliformis]